MKKYIGIPTYLFARVLIVQFVSVVSVRTKALKAKKSECEDRILVLHK
jgi:hypothetical protein